VCIPPSYDATHIPLLIACSPPGDALGIPTPTGSVPASQPTMAIPRPTNSFPESNENCGNWYNVQKTFLQYCDLLTPVSDLYGGYLRKCIDCEWHFPQRLLLPQPRDQRALCEFSVRCGVLRTTCRRYPNILRVPEEHKLYLTNVEYVYDHNFVGTAKATSSVSYFHGAASACFWHYRKLLRIQKPSRDTCYCRSVTV
jgi:hypothetical protein